MVEITGGGETVRPIVCLSDIQLLTKFHRGVTPRFDQVVRGWFDTVVTCGGGATRNKAMGSVVTIDLLLNI